MNTLIEVVWSGDFERLIWSDLAEVVSVDVEMHVDGRHGDMGFFARCKGGARYQLGRTREWYYSAPVPEDGAFEGRVCTLPGSVRAALWPWRANYIEMKEE